MRGAEEEEEEEEEVALMEEVGVSFRSVVVVVIVGKGSVRRRVAVRRHAQWCRVDFPLQKAERRS